MMYEVRCPSDPYENTSTLDYDRAVDLCYNLAEEYGYAMVVTYNGPHQQLLLDYTA